MKVKGVDLPVHGRYSYMYMYRLYRLLVHVVVTGSRTSQLASAYYSIAGLVAMYLPKSYLDLFESPHRTSSTYIDVFGPLDTYPEHLKSARGPDTYLRRDRARLSRKMSHFSVNIRSRRRYTPWSPPSNTQDPRIGQKCDIFPSFPYF